MVQLLQRNARIAVAVFLLCGVWLVPGLLTGGEVGAVPVTSAVASCPANAGIGGAPATNNSDTSGGNGCVVIKDNVNFHTFTYSGAEETWEVPEGVATIQVYLIGAGGGGGNNANNVWGGGGGYVDGTLSVTSGETLLIIVGQGGKRLSFSDVDAVPVGNTTGRYNYSFGGGGMGNGAPPYNNTFASGGGRSAIRRANSNDDLVTAGGGGGGGYSGAGGAGGGLVGQNGSGAESDSGKGGTQTTGGATGSREPGTDGIKYAGGWAGYSLTTTRQSSEAGGGGGGYFGGGAGGDNCGGGGGSSFLDNLSNATTTSGSGRNAGAKPPVNSAVPSITGSTQIGSVVTAINGTWLNGGRSTFQWQISVDGSTYSDIAGATSSTFTVLESGYLRVQEIRHSLFADVVSNSVAVNVPIASSTSTSLTATTTSSPAFGVMASTTTTSLQPASLRNTTTTSQKLGAEVSLVPEAREPEVISPLVPTSTETTTTSTMLSELKNFQVNSNSQVDVFDVEDGAPKYLSLSLELTSGELATGKKLISSAGGLQPGSKVTLEMYSTPIVLGNSVADSSGSVTFNSEMPSSIPPGIHRLILSGITKDGSPVTATAAFEIDQSGIVKAIVQAGESLSGAPSASEMERSLSAGLPVYDTTSNTASTAGLVVAATIMMAAMATSNSTKKESETTSDQKTDSESFQRDSHSQGEIGSLETAGLLVVTESANSWGDRSWTWAFPGDEFVQKFFGRIYSAVSTKSSVLSRLVADGQWVRAVFGSLQLIPLSIGLFIGIFAGTCAQGVFVPTKGVTIVIILLALFDALAGSVAWLGFSIVVIARFGISGVFDFRTILGLGVLYMGLPLLANHTRPLRRQIRSNIDRVDRFSDFVIGPILVGFAAHGVYMALNGLSGLQMVITSQADQMQWIVSIGIIVRMACEDLASYAYPTRLKQTEMPTTDGTPLTIDVATLGVKTFLYLVGAASFFGLGWRTWVVIVLMNIVPAMKLFKDNLPNSVFIHKWFPRGVLRTVIMMFVSIWFAKFVLGASTSPEHIKAMTAVLLLPGILIGSLDVFGRHGGEWPDTLRLRICGGVLWTYVLAVLLGLVTV